MRACELPGDRRQWPTTPYGCAKVFTELLGKVYSDLYGVNAGFDISAAAGQLGYQPRYSLPAGVAMYADWLEHHPY